MLTSVGKYSKFIVAVLGAVSVGLTTFAHSAPWEPTVLAVVTALATYLVPNAQSSAAPPQPPAAR